jgi:hypothetical protein
MSPGFSFGVLRPVRAWRDGAEISLGSPQQRAVLAGLHGGQFAVKLSEIIAPRAEPR